MKTSEELFLLIKSLEQTEKRYFKIYASLHIIGEKNNYVRLFEAIDKQNQYNEEKIIKRFHKEKFINNFSVAKAYLYHLVLKSLRIYHSGKSADMQIKEFLSYTEILFKKGLYKQSNKSLSKAKRIAEAYEKHPLCLEIVNWEKKILNALSFSTTNEEVWNNLMKEEEKMITNTNLLNEYWDSYAKMFMLIKKKGPSRNQSDFKKYRSIINNPPLNNEGNIFSYDSSYFHYTTYINYYYSQGDFLNYYQCNKKLLEIAESYPQDMREEGGKNMAILNNFLIGCLELKKIEEFQHTLHKLRNTVIKNPTDEIRIFIHSYSLELGMYINTGQFEKGRKISDEVESGLKKYQNKISKEYQMILYYQLFYIYFGLDQYPKALAWLNKIVNNADQKENIRSDIYSFAMILNLITHYELKNNSLLEYIIKSTYRFLYKKDRMYRFETIILNFIRKKLPQSITKKQQVLAFKELKKELETMVSKNDLEKKALQYFDFISWLESKIENKSFGEMVKKKNLL